MAKVVLAARRKAACSGGRRYGRCRCMGTGIDARALASGMSAARTDGARGGRARASMAECCVRRKSISQSAARERASYRRAGTIRTEASMPADLLRECVIGARRDGPG